MAQGQRNADALLATLSSTFRKSRKLALPSIFAPSLKPDLVFRPDVEGLRAIAIIAVLLFHSELPLFSGGFVGVDIFFVISGYLITQRIIAAEQNGGFSYQTFYVKRIRRLFPALFSTVVAAILASCLILPPELLVAMAKSAAAAIFSVANIYFFSGSGYWDSAAWAKPLLHTWSLSVEEQFYLLWPLVILYFLRRHATTALWWLFSLAILSLIVTAVLTPTNPTAAFYLTPYRIFEFAIGSLCVAFDRHDWLKVKNGTQIQVALFLSGIGAILAAIFLLTSTTQFPGWIALVPSLGAAAIVLARCTSIVGKLLDNPVMRHIGLISYSLYLIHWPVLSLLHIQVGKPDALQLFIALVGIFVLAELQFRFIEVPWRVGRNNLPSPNRLMPVAAATGVAMLSVSLSAFAIIGLDGMPWRFADAKKELAKLTLEQVNEERTRELNTLCTTRTGDFCGRIVPGKANVLVIGDSHCPDGFTIARTMYPEANFLVSSKPGCPPFDDLTGIKHMEANCAAINRRVFADIQSLASRADLAVLSIRLDSERVPQMKLLIDRLRNAGVRTLVLGPGPFFKQGLHNLVLHAENAEILTARLRAASVMATFDIDKELRDHALKAGAAYASKRNFFCPADYCKAFVDGTHDLIEFDNTHLTYAAAKAYGKAIQIDKPTDWLVSFPLRH